MYCKACQQIVPDGRWENKVPWCQHLTATGFSKTAFEDHLGSYIKFLLKLKIVFVQIGNCICPDWRWFCSGPNWAYGLCQNGNIIKRKFHEMHTCFSIPRELIRGSEHGYKTRQFSRFVTTRRRKEQDEGSSLSTLRPRGILPGIGCSIYQLVIYILPGIRCSLYQLAISIIDILTL